MANMLEFIHSDLLDLGVYCEPNGYGGIRFNGHLHGKSFKLEYDNMRWYTAFFSPGELKSIEDYFNIRREALITMYNDAQEYINR